MKTTFAALLLVALFSTLSARASTNAMFRRDGSSATVMVSGNPNDLDALNLYRSLTAPEQIIDNKRTKRMNFENAMGQRMFSIVCVLSGIIEQNGTCTVILNAGLGANIDRTANTAVFATEDPQELARLQTLFFLNTGPEIIFASNDQKLAIVLRSIQSRPVSFSITYH